MTTRRADFNPEMLWEASVGAFHSKNRVIVDGKQVIAPTCGSSWNSRDRRDGVSIFNKSTGRRIWFSPTTSDVNEIVCVDQYIVAATDIGDIFIFDRKSGDIRDVHRVKAPVHTAPVVLGQGREWEIVALSLDGNIYRFGLGWGRVEQAGKLPGTYRANLVPLRGRERHCYLAFSEQGSVILCDFGAPDLGVRQIAALTYRGFANTDGSRPTQTAVIHSSPAFDGERLYVGYARDTYYDEPALQCIDLDGRVIWTAAGDGKESFGNCRTTPALIGEYVVCAFAYSDSVHFFNKADGRLAGQIRIGQNVFQQWSSPISYLDRYAIIGRVDGVLSVVDLLDGKLSASVSLSTAEAELVLNRSDPFVSRDTYPLYPGEPPTGGICSTPTLSDDVVFVGTTAGKLSAIALGRQT